MVHMKQKLFLIFSFFVFALSVALISYNIVKTLTVKNLVDFSVYYQAINSWRQAENPYQRLFGQPTDKIPFNYPPSALFLLSLLTLLPIKAGEIILTILSFFALWLTFWIILKLLKTKISLAHFLILLAFFNQTFPVKFTLILGQINLIVLGLAYGGVYLYKNPKFKILSIILFSLSSSLKIFPLFTLPLFLILKDLQFVFSVLAVFFALNLWPSLNLFKQYYLQILPELFRPVGQPNFYDQSLLAFLLRLGFGVSLAKILWSAFLSTLFVFILLSFYRRPKNNSEVKHFSLVFALFSIGLPFSWQHHLVFGYPLIFILYLKPFKNFRKKFHNRKDFNRHIFKHLLVFFLIWIVFAFHFKNEASSLLNNPFIASYQTIVVLLIVCYSSLTKTRFTSVIFPKGTRTKFR